ncbi:MAG: hypothetical protein ACRECR_03380, partial [Thermoplasmata archaeon]
MTIVIVAVIILGLGFANVISGFHHAGNQNKKPAPTEYAVVVKETGLASGHSWSTTLNGTIRNSATSEVVYTEPNGTYSYSIATVSGYAATPSSGTVIVSGQNTSVTIAFASSSSSTSPPPAAKYAVTFTESGLPASTNWSVTLNGTPQATSGTSIAFVEPNGSYSYSVPTVDTYAPAPSGGLLVVNGSMKNVLLTFTRNSTSSGGRPYPVTFTQTGLPDDVSWGFLLAFGVENLSRAPSNLALCYQIAVGSSSEVLVPNGTYTWISEPLVAFSPKTGTYV